MASKSKTKIVKTATKSTKTTKADLLTRVELLEKENAELKNSVLSEIQYTTSLEIELERYARDLVISFFALSKFVAERKLAERVAAMLKEAREWPFVANWAVRNEVHFFADGTNWLLKVLGGPKLEKTAEIEMGTGNELRSISTWTNYGTVSFTPSSLLGMVVAEATITHIETQEMGSSVINVENSIKFSVDLMGARRKFTLTATGYIYADNSIAYQKSGIAKLSVDRRKCEQCSEVHDPEGVFAQEYSNPRDCAAFVDFKKIDIRETDNK
ncbi:hypothetical protein KA089_00255 [Candidatus Woesebacteria bacterium]|nr:hypothetical protein [Candidatus Woesebacteria bacterium]